MKVMAFILFGLQAISLYGNFSSGAYLPMNIPYLLGYFLPTIIGIILLCKHSKKQAKKESGNLWQCHVCGTENPGNELFCTQCGTRKV